MKLSTIWQVSNTDRDEFTVLDAWDEYTRGDNPEGFDEKLEELGDELAPGYTLRVVDINVDDTALLKALFDTPQLDGKIEA